MLALLFSLSQNGFLLLFLKKFFQHRTHLRNMDRRDVPNNFGVHVTVIVCHDVAHTTHLAKGKLGEGLFGFFIQMSRRFSYDLNSPDDRILFLLIGAEGRFRSVLDIGNNEAT